jgi:hypothetical protein
MFRKFLFAAILLVLAYLVFQVVGVVVLAVLYAAGYLFSLSAVPRTSCPACKGTGRARGWFFSNGRRPCRRCGGASWQYRGGVRAGLAGTQPKQPGRGRGRA